MFNNFGPICFIWTLSCIIVLPSLDWWWRKGRRTLYRRNSDRTSYTVCLSDISNSIHMHVLSTGYKGSDYFFINMTHFQTVFIVFSWNFKAAVFLIFTVWSVEQFLWHPSSKTFQHLQNLKLHPFFFLYF